MSFAGTMKSFYWPTAAQKTILNIAFKLSQPLEIPFVKS